MTTAAGTIPCGLCGRRFQEDRQQSACQTCPLGSGCHFVRCPHCGYENPVEPEWLGKLKSWLRFDESR